MIRKVSSLTFNIPFKIFMRKCLSLLFLFLISNVFAQENEYVIDAKFNINNRIIDIKQSISFTNNSLNDIDHIILNDWPHSYFNPSSPLGKRLSEDFTLNFQRSTKNQRGYTNIIEIQSENNNLNFERLTNNIDLIKVNLNNALKQKKTIKITIEYQVKIPISDFTGYGIDNDNNINLSEWFITLAKIKNNKWLIESNLDLNDLSLEPSSYKFKITYPLDFDLISDLETESIKLNKSNNIFESTIENRIHVPIILTQKIFFNKFKTTENLIISDLYNISNNKTDSLFNRVINYVDDKTVNKLLKNNQNNDSINLNFIFNKTSDYVQSKLGNYPIKKIVLSKFDLEKDPVYGLNNIPDILNPFEKSFIIEFSVLKLVISKYLKNLYPLHKRKDYWQIKGIETFLLIDYIEEYYPNLNLIGKFSNLSIIKNREYSKFKFSEQFRLFDNIISSRNISQPISSQLDSLTRINYKVINPYKSGLALKMLDDYLGDDKVSKSILEFSINNKLKKNNKSFLNILNENSNSEIFWFDNYINYNDNIDFSIKKIESEENNYKFLIKNSSKLSLPLKITLIDEENKIRSKWLDEFTNDTIIKVGYNSKVIINSEKYFSENNFSNNYSSTFKTNKKTKFILFKDFENNSINQIYYIPLFNYNLYDGLMPGV
ncbi:MAG: hypothetical protein H8E16_10695, partial [Flavobacteriales bacterium]|nr:hypothetical protein [Flavobacteriales bacterium]